MATISKYQASGVTLFEVRYRTPDRRTTRKRGFKTARDAKAFANSVEVRKSTGDYASPTLGRATVGDLAPDWLARTQQAVAATTYVSYEYTWRSHVAPRWGQVRVADVNVLDVEAWIASRVRDGYSASTVRRAHGILSSILDDAVKGKRISSNPAKGVGNVPKEVAKRHVYLSSDDVHRLADAAGKHGALVLTLAYTGIRWGEAAALRVRNVEFLKRRLTVAENAVRVGRGHVVGPPKSGKPRSVPVPDFVLDALSAQCAGKAPDDLVFPGRNGGYMPHPNAYTGWFAGAVRRIGIQRITPHDLRHACASLAVSAGVNVLALQRMLGHARPSMTLDVYSDLFEDDLDAVADVMDARYARGTVPQIVSKMGPRGIGESG